MVGDRRARRARRARATGFAAIGVLWGIGSERELRDAGADALADSPGGARDPARARVS